METIPALFLNPLPWARGILAVSGSILVLSTVAAAQGEAPLDLEVVTPGEIELSWTEANAILEWSSQLDNWQALGLTPLSIHGRKSLKLPAVDPAAFFRLRAFRNALPPDPAAVAPALDAESSGNFQSATSFLYEGAEPVQIGVPPGTIERARAAVLRGRVLRRDGSPLAGVTITILDHPEFGLTRTRADGWFDLAVNGGGTLNVVYQTDGFCPVQRKIRIPWRDYRSLPEVVMTAFDPVVTPVDFGNDSPQQVACGSVETDADGVRQAMVLFPPGTRVWRELRSR